MKRSGFSRILLSTLVCLGTFSLSAPLSAQQNFPFNEQQQLTPLEIKIQKYKLERLRIQQQRDTWTIIRGVNEPVDDYALLKMVGKTEKIEETEFKQTVGNSVAIGGLVVVGAGGLLLSDIVKFQNSALVGIGLIILGGAAAVGAELWAGNIGDESGHIIERPEAEGLIKSYNEKLKKELGLEGVENLD